MILHLLLLSIAISLISSGEGKLSRLIINLNETSGVVDPNENNFLRLIQQRRCLVDKTLFIRDIVEKTGRLVMLTCPPKWGKTTLLNMLKFFLQVQVDERGKRFPLKDRLNHQFFRYGRLPDGRQFHQAPLISNYSNVVDNWMGWHPVINISFRVPQTFEMSEKSIKSFIKERIRDAFAEHKYLIKMMDYVQETKIRDVNTSKHDSADFKEIYLDSGSVSEEAYKKCLKTLSQILERYFERPAVLLIDEFVSVINNVLISNLQNKKKILRFYLNIVNSVINDNEALKKAIFFGTLRTDKELRWLDNHEFLRSGIFENVVINEDDMKEFSGYLGIPVDTRKSIRFWYNGYRGGPNSSLEIYNPSSLAKYMVRGSFESYRVREEDDIGRLLPLAMENKFAEKAICNILRGNSLNFKLSSEIPLGFTTSDFETIWYSKDSENRPNGDLILRFLLNTGYLSSCKQTDTAISEFLPHITVSLCVPNEESRLELRDYVSAFYVKLFRVSDKTTLLNSSTELAEYLNNFILSKETRNFMVEKSLENFLLLMPPFDEQMHEKNVTRVYKNMARSLINMLLALSPYNFNFVSHEVGYESSRPDALLIRDDLLAAIEFKFGHSNGDPTDPAKVDGDEKIMDGLLTAGFEQVRKIKTIKIRVFSNKTVIVSGKTTGLWEH